MRVLGADERGHRQCTGDIWRTDGALAIHDGALGLDSEGTMTVRQSNFTDDYLPNQPELEDDAVDKVGVPIEFYNFVN